MKPERAVLGWLLLAAVAIVFAQALTRYPDQGSASHIFWLLISALLLYRVSRGGNVARSVLLAFALLGAMLCAPGAFADDRLLGLVIAYGIQVVALLAQPVRRWTSSRPQSAVQPGAGAAGSSFREIELMQ